MATCTLGTYRLPATAAPLPEKHVALGVPVRRQQTDAGSGDVAGGREDPWVRARLADGRDLHPCASLLCGGGTRRSASTAAKTMFFDQEGLQGFSHLPLTTAAANRIVTTHCRMGA